MEATITHIDAKDADIADTHIKSYGDDSTIFIRQRDTSGHEECLMFGRDGIPALIEALSTIIK